MDKILDSLTSALFALMALFSSPAQEEAFYGYAEGDYLYIAAREDGYIDEMAVTDGAEVAAGDMLFTLDRERQQDAVARAEANLAARRSELADKSQGSRPEELAVIEAKRQQAIADLTLARTTFKRTDELVARRALPESRRDEDQATLNAAIGTLRQYEAELASARLPSRQDLLEAARQAVRAAEAELSQATTDLADRSLPAPTSARVDRIFLYPGEFANSGSPVLALLPPDKIKIRFFLPEPLFSRIRVGDTVTVLCDGCPDSLRARVTYLSPEAEYTPPVIFSRDERSKLVFMVEAKPERPDSFHPGQPVEVRLQP